jgi:hypothetical protein
MIRILLNISLQLPSNTHVYIYVDILILFIYLSICSFMNKHIIPSNPSETVDNIHLNPHRKMAGHKRSGLFVENLHDT